MSDHDAKKLRVIISICIIVVQDMRSASSIRKWPPFLRSRSSLKLRCVLIIKQKISCFYPPSKTSMLSISRGIPSKIHVDQTPKHTQDSSTVLVVNSNSSIGKDSSHAS